MSDVKIEIKKPKVLIDEVEVEIDPGSTIIQAAKKAGKHIAHFCYHEGLSIVGQCRMCFVEIEGQKKLATACSTPVADGMKIKTASDAVKSGQNSTIEFILLNHPLDCPICDRGGECKLQDYTLEYGPPRSRMVDDKVLRDKHRPLSKDVVLDQERCILCTRCTRFSKEVDGRAELVVNERGNDSCIDIFEGKTFDSPFSGNVVDLCPVGALTAEDFRFQARPWELKSHSGICTGCAVGCNVEIDTQHRHPGIPRPDKAAPRPVIKRLTPRKNRNVNDWWLCDKGRWGYHFHNEDAKRLYNPMLRKGSGTESKLENVSLREFQLEIEASTGDWEFRVDGTFPHEGIAWAKDLAKSWKDRGRKVALNPSANSDRLIKIWSQFIAKSPWGVAPADWNGITEVVSTKTYRDLEAIAPILSLKLGQKVSEGKLKWTQTPDVSTVKVADNVAILFDVPQSKSALDQLEKISPSAKLLILWTQVNSRGLLNEGLAPTEILSEGSPSNNLFLFTQKTQNELPAGLIAKLVEAKRLFVADSFMQDSWGALAHGVLPLTPLYESRATFTNLEGHQQIAEGIRIYHPNTPSIHRGSDEMVSASLKLL